VSKFPTCNGMGAGVRRRHAHTHTVDDARRWGGGHTCVLSSVCAASSVCCPRGICEQWLCLRLQELSREASCQPAARPNAWPCVCAAPAATK
jgi:hypothetical protein